MMILKRVDSSVAYPAEVRSEAFSQVVPIEIAAPGRVEWWNKLPVMGSAPFKHGDLVTVIATADLTRLAAAVAMICARECADMSAVLKAGHRPRPGKSGLQAVADRIRALAANPAELLAKADAIARARDGAKEGT